MEKKYSEIDKIGNKTPFRVPEGYFDQLNDQIKEKLSNVEVEKPQTINLWGRIKPWVYMAAMFAGIALMFKVFKGDFDKSSQVAECVYQKEINQSHLFEEECYNEVYDYFEYQAIEQSYREAFYIGEN